MLASLYVGYVILRAWLNPSLAPEPSKEEHHVDLPEWAEKLPGGRSRLAIPAMVAALRGGHPGISVREAPRPDRHRRSSRRSWSSSRSCSSTTPPRPSTVIDTGGLEEIGAEVEHAEADEGGLAEPPSDGLAEPPQEGLEAPPGPSRRSPPA